ncbi:MAG: flagellar basal body rod protein FlgB [Lachnospiraceae bacterium]
MINSNAFNYINILDKAADAAWLRNDAISNNIANVDTPGYKRQDVEFEAELSRALKNNRYKTVDEKVNAIQGKNLNPRTYTDYSNYSYRLDGNNVDIDTENVELAANQIKYNGLIQAMSQEFANLRMVMQ